MLYYDKIDISEEVDFNQASKSKKSDIFHYWYFLDKEYKFQPDVCNECHNVLMMSMNASNVAFLNIHGADYRYIIIRRISKNEVIN